MAARQAVDRGGRAFLKHHSLSLVSGCVVILWVMLYSRSSPATHASAFFGNAIADWIGVMVTIIATKYLYEIGSAESRQPSGRLPSRFREVVRDHSLTIFLTLTGIAWVVVFLRGDSESKWGQVASSIVSEWTQLLGLVLMTKNLFEDKSKESRTEPPKDQ